MLLLLTVEDTNIKMTMTYYELKNFWENSGERDEQGWEVEPLDEAQTNTLAVRFGIPLKHAHFAWEWFGQYGAQRGWHNGNEALETQLNNITAPPMWRFYNIMARKIQNGLARR